MVIPEVVMVPDAEPGTVTVGTVNETAWEVVFITKSKLALKESSGMALPEPRVRFISADNP